MMLTELRMKSNRNQIPKQKCTEVQIPLQLQCPSIDLLQTFRSTKPVEDCWKNPQVEIRPSESASQTADDCVTTGD